MNILTFDLEDWFHILDFGRTENPDQWDKFESRIEANTERLLKLLEAKKIRATFFCLGWIAEKYPHLIRRIAERHEIACHSMNHQLLYKQSKSDFVEDLKKSVGLLRSLSGQSVNAYRAPGFSLGKEHGYVFEELNKIGISIDCSVFPARRNHGGIPDFPFSRPCKISGDNFEVVEFPMNVIPFFGKKIVFSGGGYFRLMPYSFIKNQMEKASYVMTYFHPRDFDPGQPMLEGLPYKRRLMSYVGLNSSFRKLEQLLNDFEFVSVGEGARLGNELPVVRF